MFFPASAIVSALVQKKLDAGTLKLRIEAARLALGHCESNTTLIHAEGDLAKAAAIKAEVDSSGDRTARLSLPTAASTITFQRASRLLLTWLAVSTGRNLADPGRRVAYK